MNVPMIFVVEMVAIGEKKQKKTWFLKCWENDQINGFSNDLEIKQYAYKASKQHIQCNEEKVPKQITYRIQLNTV